MNCLAVQNWIPCLTFLVLVANVILFLKYLRATNKIKDASIDQSEGLSKPVITLRRQDSAPTDLEIMDEGLLTKIASPIELVNIGNGPALNIKWEILRDPSNALINGFASYIEPGKSVATHLQRHVAFRADHPMTMQVKCTYHSLSRAEYVSMTDVEDMKVKTFVATRRNT